MTKPDLAAIRRRIAGRRGRGYWQSLEELAAAPQFLERVRLEFPDFEAMASQAYDRRRFLQLAAASMALGLAACGPEPQPRDRQPYVAQPLGMVPGRARYYATATALQAYGAGVLIEHQMGRPIKVEGNPDHPASLGATSAIGQATILSLYDPYRAEAATKDGGLSTWEAFAAELLARRPKLLERHGAGIALLTGTVTSPALVAEIGRLKQQFPELRWHQWEAINRDQVTAGAKLAFGRPVDLLPDFSAADIILAVEGDFLESAPGHLKFARDFAARRRPAEMKEHMSRLYAIESTPTLSGAKADHILSLPPHQIGPALRRIAAGVGAGPKDWSGTGEGHGAEIDSLAQELKGA
ncbi:MAG: TAT-variant-translocated molybdopterin oxidoreductase, partial [Stellaceae bacterium]